MRVSVWVVASMLGAAACTPRDPAAPPPTSTPTSGPVSSGTATPPPADTVPPVASTPGDRTPEQVWDEARARGLAFRASGNEPGWIAEVSPRQGLRVLLAYGTDSLRAPAPALERAGDSLVYTAAAGGGRSVRLVARATPCQDDMSGAQHSHTVRLTVDAQTFSGCGRVYDAP